MILAVLRNKASCTQPRPPSLLALATVIAYSYRSLTSAHVPRIALLCAADSPSEAYRLSDEGDPPGLLSPPGPGPATE